MPVEGELCRAVGSLDRGERALDPDAVAGPFTGGQFCAHVPLQFDVVDVSGANE